MTDSPSDTAAPDVEDALAGLAASVAEAVGADRWTAEHDTAKVFVARERWREALTAAKEDAGLDYFSWLSAIDWSREVAVGDAVEAPDDLRERYEVLCMLGTVDDNRRIVFSTDVPKDDAGLDSVTGVFGGAAWHEREAYEMFGIDFRDHPQLIKLYLPDAFEGFPLRKSYPLLSREVKPWPGLVDVEDMPSTENVEAEESGDDEEGAE